MPRNWWSRRYASKPYAAWQRDGRSFARLRSQWLIERGWYCSAHRACAIRHPPTGGCQPFSRRRSFCHRTWRQRFYAPESHSDADGARTDAAKWNPTAFANNPLKWFEARWWDRAICPACYYSAPETLAILSLWKIQKHGNKLLSAESDFRYEMEELFWRCKGIIFGRFNGKDFKRSHYYHRHLKMGMSKIAITTLLLQKKNIPNWSGVENPLNRVELG